MNISTFIRRHSVSFSLLRQFSNTHTIEILRWSPDSNSKPKTKKYSFNSDECGPMILHSPSAALVEKVDTEGSFPPYIKKLNVLGICGSCGMNINGTNQLLSKKGKDCVYPLPHMPIIKDLVVDMSRSFKHYNNIKPYLISREENVNRSQSIEERARLDGLYECILCGCCQTSCPSYWWNGDIYLGPMVLHQSLRWILDSRDDAKNERLSYLLQGHPDRFFRCHSIYNCTICCPKDLNPAKSIAVLKGLVHKKLDNDKKSPPRTVDDD